MQHGIGSRPPPSTTRASIDVGNRPSRRTPLSIFLTLLGIVVLIGGVVLGIFGFEGEYRDASVGRKLRGGVLAPAGLIARVVGISLTILDDRSIGIQTQRR